ncbi:MAG: ABC transporter ATP-binding protein [Spirochaetales bacterium]|nr:ABC transporter ATP-binding protein [Spirochaetales bacterium]
MAEAFLAIHDLETRFSTYEGTARVLDKINLTMERSEFLGIVGETGCGKSVMGYSVMNILPRNGYVASGEVVLQGENLTVLSEREMTKVRGTKVSMIFQHPQASLNPVFSLGVQITDMLRNKTRCSKGEAKRQGLALFSTVGLPDPEYLFSKYPHELSGGMQQRVMIAMALSCSPGLLIADEPTTALDVTIQAQILTLMKRLRDETGMAVMLITHSMGVVAKTCEKLAVLYAGQVAETGSIREVFREPLHPYTRGLLGSIPSLEQAERLVSIPGSICSLIDPPEGCRFHPRCPEAMEICGARRPPVTRVSSDHTVCCHLYSSGGRA